MNIIGFRREGKLYAKVPAEVKHECIGCVFVNDHRGCANAPTTCNFSETIYKEILISESE